MALPRLLVVFGLLGTLIERMHFSISTEGAPPPTTVLGPQRLWVRPQAVAVLQRLSKTCDLAVWSSSTRRNTFSVLHAAFGTDDPSHPNHVPFKFQWSREHTSPDEFLRVSAAEDFTTVKDLSKVWALDGGNRYTPARTIVVEDTSSKVRAFADHFVRVPGFEGVAALSRVDDAALTQLEAFIEHELLAAPDVRSHLPMVRIGESS